MPGGVGVYRPPGAAGGGLGGGGGGGMRAPGAGLRARPKAAAPPEPTPLEKARAAAAELTVPPRPERRSLVAVEVDGSALMKIARHAHEHAPDVVGGQLLGMDRSDGVLEVTGCFALPSRFDPVPPSSGGSGPGGAAEARVSPAEYEQDMLKCLREVGADVNTVGRYTSTNLESFLTGNSIDQLVKDHESVTSTPSALLVYDPKGVERGALSLRAFRVSDELVAQYRNPEQQLAPETALTSADLLVELPVRVRSSALTSALLLDLDDLGVTHQDFDVLNMAISSRAQSALDSLSGAAEDFQTEQGRLQYYVRNQQRQRATRAVWLQKRKAENAARRERGEEELPETGDPATDAEFKPIAGPKRIDSLMVGSSINATVGSVNDAVTASLARMRILNPGPDAAAAATADQ